MGENINWEYTSFYSSQLSCANNLCTIDIYLKDDKDDDPATGSIVTKVSKDMGYESIYSI